MKSIQSEKEKKKKTSQNKIKQNNNSRKHQILSVLWNSVIQLNVYVLEFPEDESLGQKIMAKIFQKLIKSINSQIPESQ